MTTTKGFGHLPKMMPISECQTLKGQGYKLYLGELHDGPLSAREYITDRQGYHWVKATN